MGQLRYLSLILMIGIGSLGTLAPAHALSYLNPYSYTPYTSSVNGTVVFNTGSQLIVRTSSGDLNVYLQPQTTVLGLNNTLLSLNAVGIGSQVEIYGAAAGGGIMAQSILVLSSSLYGGGYPYLQTPLIVPPLIYQDFMYDWPTFIRKHPHDWQRWQGHWQRFRHGDRDRNHRWNRDGRLEGRSWDGRGTHGRVDLRGEGRGDLFDRLERRQHERRNINR